MQLYAIMHACILEIKLIMMCTYRAIATIDSYITSISNYKEFIIYNYSKPVSQFFLINYVEFSCSLAVCMHVWQNHYKICYKILCHGHLHFRLQPKLLLRNLAFHFSTLLLQRSPQSQQTQLASQRRLWFDQLDNHSHQCHLIPGMACTIGYYWLVVGGIVTEHLWTRTILCHCWSRSIFQWWQLEIHSKTSAPYQLVWYE